MPLKKRKQEVTQSYATIGVAQNTQIAPGPEEEGIDSTKNKTTRKNDSPVPQLCTERGDVGSTKYAGTILNPAQKLRKRILSHI